MTGVGKMPQDVRARVTGQESRNGRAPKGAALRYLTDLGNAERFVDDHGDVVRYCYPWDRWLFWDGKRWATDIAGKVPRLAKATVRGIYGEAAGSTDEGMRKALARHATRSEAEARIRAMIALARSELPVSPKELDSGPWLLNAANGTVDLRTGELREHRHEDLITKLAPVTYPLGGDAATPAWDQFLERVLPSQALRRFVQKVIGYAATGATTEEILVILHGIGANGKSTLVNVIMGVLGDYAMQAAPDLLLAKRGSHPTELADLFGARFVASVETDEGRRLAEGLVKQLTGRDPIRARKMREDFWQFDPTHTVFLATNRKPEVRGTDPAIWRRIKLIPFDVSIPESEQDKRLPAKLREERPGILAWIVRGCLDHQREGLGEPEEVRTATRGYRVEMDTLAAFIEERCVEHPRASGNATPLYDAYKAWCDQDGEQQVSQRKFGLRLGERGFVKDKSGTVTWHGIGLRSDRPDPDHYPDLGPAAGPSTGEGPGKNPAYLRGVAPNEATSLDLTDQNPT